MYGGPTFGALVYGAGLIVSSLPPTPPPATVTNGYGTAAYGAPVYGSGPIVGSEVPVPPAARTVTSSGGRLVLVTAQRHQAKAILPLAPVQAQGRGRQLSRETTPDGEAEWLLLLEADV